MATLVSIWLALTLAVSAAAKAWRSEQAAQALATYGVRDQTAQRVALWLLIAVELALAVGLAAALRWAQWAAAALFVAFACGTAVALLAGRAGRPCACFGADSRLGWSSSTRAVVLAVVAGVDASGVLPRAPVGYDRWLTLGLSLSLLAVGGLAVALLALAREVGVLRLAAGNGRGALEIESEGPELGTVQPWAQRIELGGRAVLALAVFSSDGCPMCAQVAPAVEHVAADALLAVCRFDEGLDAAVWAAAAVPGSPYAVALDLDGVALAKGTFNSLAQLESVLATARRRERGLALAA
jgi:hypothetical protein